MKFKEHFPVTKFEITRAIAVRAQALSNGAMPYKDCNATQNMSFQEIATREYDMGLLNHMVSRRTLPPDVDGVCEVVEISIYR